MTTASEQTAALNETFAVPGVLAFDEPHPGFQRARISSPACTAELYLYGAHLAAWQPVGAEPVLFLSPNSLFERGKAIRGGIPVIFPWFGPRTKEVSGGRTDGPSHGFARTSEWELAFAAVAGDTVHLTLTLGPSEESRAAGFDHFRVALEFTLGATLRVRMTVANEGNEPLVFEEALHTYFTVSDAEAVEVRGLTGVDYLDKTDGMKRKTEQEEMIVFRGETDRPYLNTAATVAIEDPGLARSLVIEKGGSETTVVWNPGAKLAATLADIGPEAWKHYACVETANAAENRITLAPKSAHVMEAHIHVGRRA